MIRPYLAVIKDSFREAMASRVLWIMLVLITVLLLSLAPLGVREKLYSQFTGNDLLDVPELAERLKKEGQSNKPSPGRRIWSLIDADVRTTLSETDTENADQRHFLIRFELTAALNGLLDKPDLYDEEAWQDVAVVEEARELMKRGVDDLSEEELARLNRLLLEAAYPNLIRTSPQTSAHLTYLIWDTPSLVPMTRKQFETGIKFVLSGFMQFFVGVIAVFVAVLVTSPIIPRTFEVGSIELLLSKPISRVLLFLAKFAGGCSFILVNAAYMIVGLWLIVGVRFGVWNHRLLLCIPIFLFLFAIYFSVSALAGLIWRSAIVSVVVAALFWATCFAVGFSKGVTEALFLNPTRLVQIIDVGEAPLVMNERGNIFQWQEEERQWEAVFMPDGGAPETAPFMPLSRPMIGPVYDRQGERLLAVESNWQNYSPVGQGSATWVAPRSDEWIRTEGAAAPAGTTAIFAGSQSGVLLVGRQGIFRLVGDPEEKREDMKFFGVRVPIPRSNNVYQNVGPEQPLRLLPPVALALDDQTGSLAVWSRGLLAVYESDENGKYGLKRQTEFELEEEAVVLGFAGSTILAAHQDGRIEAIDSESLQVQHQFEVEGQNAPRFVEASRGGTWFAVVFHNRKLWLYDAQRQEMTRRGIAGQGEISAAGFVGPDRLRVADRVNRVTEYDLTESKRTERWSPKMNMFERSYRYVILPVYTVYPKPGELDDTVHYLLTEKETVAPGADNLQDAQVKLNPWSPVYSSALFVLVVLAIGCLYVWRAEL